MPLSQLSGAPEEIQWVTSEGNIRYSYNTRTGTTIVHAGRQVNSANHPFDAVVSYWGTSPARMYDAAFLTQQVSAQEAEGGLRTTGRTGNLFYNYYGGRWHLLNRAAAGAA